MRSFLALLFSLPLIISCSSSGYAPSSGASVEGSGLLGVSGPDGDGPSHNPGGGGSATGDPGGGVAPRNTTGGVTLQDGGPDHINFSRSTAGL